MRFLVTLICLVELVFRILHADMEFIVLGEAEFVSEFVIAELADMFLIASAVTPRVMLVLWVFSTCMGLVMPCQVLCGSECLIAESTSLVDCPFFGSRVGRFGYSWMGSEFCGRALHRSGHWYP